MNELSGGIKNAIERGQNLEDIKRSFVNAGYNVNEIETASNELVFQNIGAVPTQPSYPSLPLADGVKKRKSHLGLIILIFVCLLMLAGAALLGLYWDKVTKFLGL